MTKKKFSFIKLVKSILYFWVRSKVYPQNWGEHIQLDDNTRICFILPSKSLIDHAVLYHYCEKFHMPLPLKKSDDISDGSFSSLLTLSRTGFLRKRDDKKVFEKLSKLASLSKEESLKIKLIPVSVFWGRHPGKEEKSLFKLFFFDNENGGIFQKFITFFVQGKSVFCNFGKEIEMEKLEEEGRYQEKAIKKLERVLRVHFSLQRETVLGPHIYNRQRVMKKMILSPYVQKEIREEIKEQNSSYDRVSKKAHKYAEEVAAHLSTHAIRFYDIFLTWLWQKIYDGIEVKNGERVRELAEKYELVYVPSHRSHLDYLLIGYQMYSLGMIPAHTIAGDNLNFWPVGPILRRGGGVFIRRKFAGNKLYGSVVKEFVHYLLSSGFQLCYYPEGGRSRSGYLLEPKIGILTMVIDSLKRQQGDSKKKIKLIPVYIGYDRLAEEKSYYTELKGKRKSKESIGQLMQAVKILRKNFGKAYISFGNAIDLNDEIQPKNIKELEINHDEKREVLRISRKIMCEINHSAVITPVSLVSLILLSAPKKALTIANLQKVLEILLTLIQENPLHQNISIPEERDTSLLIEYAEKYSEISRFIHKGGDVIYIDESKTKLLNYYKNNISHLYILPSLLLQLIQMKPILRNECIEPIKKIYKLITYNFFADLSDDNLDKNINRSFDDLVSKGVVVEVSTLENGEKSYHRPNVFDNNYSSFIIIKNIVQDILRPHLIFSMLVEKDSHRRLTRNKLKSDFILMYEKLSILSGTNIESDFYEKTFLAHMKLLAQLGYVTIDFNDNEEKIIINEEFLELLSVFRLLLSVSDFNRV